MPHWYCHYHNEGRYNKNTSTYSISLIPTIELCRDDFLDEDGNPEDCSFSIVFRWLCFSFSINRVWGSVYDR